MGFEATPVGSYTSANAVSGWTVSSRTANGVCPATLWNAGSSEFSIVATPFMITPAPTPMLNLLLNSPLGGTKIARLNSQSLNSNQTKLSQNYTVTNSNALLQFAFAGYWQNGGTGHNCCEQPGMYFTMYSCTGAPLACSSLSLVSICSSPSYSGSYTLQPNYDIWTNWQLRYIDLTPYIGSCVRVEFMTTDCSNGDHYGTSFVDFKTSAHSNYLNLPTNPNLPPNVDGVINFCPGSNIAKINAPIGYAAYQWGSSLTGLIPAPQGTMQTISISNPILGSVYTITLTSPTGCTYVKTYTLNYTNVNVAAVGSSSTCFNGSSGTATVGAIGSGSGYNYTWTNSTNSVVGTSSIVLGLPTGVYSIQVSAIGNPSCGTAIATTTIGIAPPSVIQLSKPYCGNEAYLMTNGGINHQWYNGLNPIPSNQGGTASNYTVTNPINNSIYYLSYTSSYNCKDSVEFNLIASSPGSVSVSNISTVCPNSNNGSGFIGLNPSLGANPGINGFTVTNASTLTPTYSSSIYPSIYNSYSVSGLSAGTYSVNVFDGSCKYGTTFSVSPYVFDFTVTSTPSNICSGSQAILSVNFNPLIAPNQYNFSWTPSNFISPPTTAINMNVIINPTVTLGQSLAHTFFVNVTPTVVNCPLTKSIVVNVSNPVTPTITAITPSFCGNSAPYYTIGVNPVGGIFETGISGTNSPVSSSGQIIPALAKNGINTFTYTNNQGGCFAKATGSFLVRKVDLHSVGNNTICSSETLIIIASGASTYTWLTWPVLTGSSIVVSPSVSSNYTVSANDSTTGCNSTQSFSILVHPKPNVNFSGNTQVCAGKTTSLTATGANTYTWSSGYTTTAITFSPLTSTSIFTLTGQNTITTCTNTREVVINRIQNPTIKIIGDTKACRGESVTLSATGADTYVWNTYLVGSTIHFPTTTGSDQLNFEVVGTNTNTQCSSANTITVALYKCSYTGLIDNQKETSHIKLYPNPIKNYFFIETETKVELEIYNELGQLVFKNNFEMGKHELRLTELPNGLYFVKARKGDSYDIIKMVKED